MPLSILYLNFIYLFIKKEKDQTFYLFTINIIVSLFFTLFSNYVLVDGLDTKNTGQDILYTYEHNFSGNFYFLNSDIYLKRN